jgi:hypothetical protein
VDLNPAISSNLMDFDSTTDERVPRPLRKFETGGYELGLGVDVNNTPGSSSGFGEWHSRSFGTLGKQKRRE